MAICIRTLCKAPSISLFGRSLKPRNLVLVTVRWPDTLPAPQAWLEFEVESVDTSTAELESMGYRMLIKNKKEPWGQTVSRFLDADGLLVGLTFTPWMRDKK